MKILFSSYAYVPGIGGIETVSGLLAREFIAAGHEVILITETPGNAGSDSFQVVRRPSLPRLWNLLRWCDVVFQNNISLRHLIPALLARKPILIAHQTWLRTVGGGIGWNDRVKRALLSRVKNVAVSRALAVDMEGRAPASPDTPVRLGPQSSALQTQPMFAGGSSMDTTVEVIGNPYDDETFKIRPNVTRDRDLIFVGRLVSDKGADVLIRAVRILAQRNLPVNLTIIGRGPEQASLVALVRQLGLERTVTFVGEKSGPELSELMNQHAIIVIPSRWAEPFGVVALEGIACGCIAVGSANGGLPEAIGNCGMTFQNRDSEELANRLADLLRDAQLREKFRTAAPAHLERFRAHSVAQRYLALLGDLAP